ncbi:MAG: hypothetical protein HOM18_04850 [Candidatus Marinimicrobia bacterium]|jgi:hypothetical protein|nr:hypothetical protein [Candidatus Neomarinimicrobiota bacterium]MBT4034525.1 hypothetical protein [Candidatus Neomarinimicrobiota bacterium]MBT4360617.1 hypothetical protein [Candidatus Neomarinimicrobiota bacterium]MBT4420743.1 hypothetical protein [Candidatus Neomarinimicrobiota bacterium]MBT4991795.1 hypothetical protein [Candidatus Neomarinimicrobiota bacterium]
MSDNKSMFPVALSDIEILLERNVFMEPSGSFKLSILGTGEVELKPRGYVLVEPVTTDIQRDEVKDLIAAALEIGFFQMEDDYSEESELTVTSEGTIEQGFGDILDGEATTYTIMLGKHTKTVYAHYGYPKRLEEFYQLVLEITRISEMLEEWVED